MRNRIATLLVAVVLSVGAFISLSSTAVAYIHVPGTACFTHSVTGRDTCINFNNRRVCELFMLDEYTGEWVCRNY